MESSTRKGVKIMKYKQICYWLILAALSSAGAGWTQWHLVQIALS